MGGVAFAPAGGLESSANDEDSGGDDG